MRRYVLMMKRNFAVFGAGLSSYLHRFGAVFWWIASMMIVFLVMLLVTIVWSRLSKSPPSSQQHIRESVMTSSPRMSATTFSGTQLNVSVPSPDTDGIAADSVPKNSTTTTTLHVNNQPIPVPASGVVHKDITSQGGTTSLTMSTSSSTSGASQTQSSMDVNLSTTSQSAVMQSDASP